MMYWPGGMFLQARLCTISSITKLLHIRKFVESIYWLIVRSRSLEVASYQDVAFRQWLGRDSL